MNTLSQRWPALVSRHAALPVQALFITCIFLSAFLLFLVQPIIAKQITPWFGGSAAVWTTALMFFQLLLLAGYLYSDLATRWLRPRTHAWVHVGLLVLAVVLLPIVPETALKPDPHKAPIGQVLWVLLATVGLPYFCLSTTGPLLQAWYSRLFPRQRVYRLFALSNLASLAALLAYPFVIEPFTGSLQQAQGWSLVFCLFALLCATSAWAAGRPKGQAAAASEMAGSGWSTASNLAPTWADFGLWLLLSMMGSMLLLAITSHITQNIAPVPFLWLLPLSLYLLSFILCFEGRGGYRRAWFTAPLILLLAAMAWCTNLPPRLVAIGWAVPLYAVGFFVCCMFCHGELSLRKPGPQYLTRFYLCLSLGGALGGLAVGALAPAVLDNYYELPLMLAAMSVLMLWLLRRYLTANKAAWVVLALAVASALLTASMAWVFHRQHAMGVVSQQRNFYAASQVVESRGGQGEAKRALFNGTILHGTQLRSEHGQRTPTTYYGTSSGVAEVMRYTAGRVGRHVGVIGLGVGTMAAWGQSGDDFRFYELNPHSQQIAERDFTYLKNSPAHHSVVLGDARLMLEAELAEGRRGDFDVLVVDAFSGDSIPVHLLTREALAIYRQHLRPGGIIAFHVSNLYLDLAPVVLRLAVDAGMQAVQLKSRPSQPETPSYWVLVTQDQAFVSQPALLARKLPLASVGNLAPWTDGHNNLFEALH
ncbi:fused MFS/spermidine synthase [Ideonella azotifigens]|uniref:Fused MFS/spermidine synthase n=1 Tax=Ideonella azotifigens TaxID=513160 RepID=A0ABN1JNY1_9BURK|nr:fused MFS/spermidine synthase [Ideonella azotifigens]MCD2340006.1 fused MFS/spermidine synthase [Ideonella azotifigens]